MRNPKSLVPLKPLVFDVLLILNEVESHGYGISKALEERSPEGPRVFPGNLYRTLSSMMERKLIEKAPRARARTKAAREPRGDERRRYFRITEFGREVATAEAERLRDRLETARAQRLLTDSRTP